MMDSKSDDLWELSTQIKDTLEKGHKIFMCGCGATGRLSLVLETLYRQKFGQTHQVISFMAGGDFALIKSVESFEDKTEYGERQLMELGFGPEDLLLASTEGGETPFVIGACQKAAAVSRRRPYFLYCNPDEVLMPILRSKEVIENKNIKKINLTVGPMAISGSTRMQSSTVLMLGIGMGLLYSHKDREVFDVFYKDFLHRLKLTKYEALAPLTKLEAGLYQSEKYLNYVTDPFLAISILTDTTERSPTFSLRPFENRLDSESLMDCATFSFRNLKPRATPGVNFCGDHHVR
jgi:N-acetylmuramic acid 6-phosphate etherase